MSKIVAIMSMSLDGFVADPKGGVGEVFDWYVNSGKVEFHTGGSDPMTFKVSAPSAEHLRALTSGLGATRKRYSLSTNDISLLASCQGLTGERAWPASEQKTWKVKMPAQPR